MSVVQDQVSITDGPLRFEFFTSLMRGDSQTVNFALEHQFFGEKVIAVHPHEVIREDGSGHLWIVNATAKPTRLNWAKREVSMFYRTSSHTGFVSTETRRIIPAAQGRVITIVNGPSLEDFFRSLVEGDMRNRMSVQFQFNSTLAGSAKWVVVIDGVGRRADQSWRYYARLQKPVDDQDFELDLRVVGNYSPTDRTGQLYLDIQNSNIAL